jgi:hypothetical protein
MKFHGIGYYDTRGYNEYIFRKGLLVKEIVILSEALKFAGAKINITHS